EHEADRAAVLLHPRGDLGEMCRDRFSLVAEKAGRLAFAFADFAAEIAEQLDAERAAGAAVGIEQHAETATGDRGDTHLIEHALTVFFLHVRRDVEFADAVPGGAGEVA